MVLLVTHSGDFFTIDRVAAALARRGVRFFRLDTDRFPTELELGLVDRGRGLEAWLAGRPV